MAYAVSRRPELELCSLSTLTLVIGHDYQDVGSLMLDRTSCQRSCIRWLSKGEAYAGSIGTTILGQPQTQSQAQPESEEHRTSNHVSSTILCDEAQRGADCATNTIVFTPTLWRRQ